MRKRKQRGGLVIVIVCLDRMRSRIDLDLDRLGQPVGFGTVVMH
jgi:hypothetical protein